MTAPKTHSRCALAMRVFFFLTAVVLFKAIQITDSALEPMPTYPPARFIDPNDPDINVGMLVCPWLNHIALKMNYTSIGQSRSKVRGAINSLTASAWKAMRIPKSLLLEISDNFTYTPCELEPEKYRNDPQFMWHPWSVGKDCLDGPSAAPANHKVIADTPHMRLLNVYAPALALETFHAHMRMSIFIVWGTPIAIKHHDEFNNVTADLPEWNGKDPKKLSIVWMHPEWLHANFNKKSMGLSNAPNCPQNLAPTHCDGFMFRVELKLNEVGCME